VAIGLGLPEPHFESYFRKPIPMLAPSALSAAKPTNVDHIGTPGGPTPSPSLTPSLPRMIPRGLEILSESGEWVTGTARLKALASIGLADEAVTDGIFTATSASVINRYGPERYSVPYFVNPSYHTSFAPHVTNPRPRPRIQGH